MIGKSKVSIKIVLTHKSEKSKVDGNQ